MTLAGRSRAMVAESAVGGIDRIETCREYSITPQDLRDACDRTSYAAAKYASGKRWSCSSSAAVMTRWPYGVTR